MAKTYKKKMPAKKAARRTPGGKARKTKKTGVKKAVKAALAKAKAAKKKPAKKSSAKKAVKRKSAKAVSSLLPEELASQCEPPFLSRAD
jgi:hypothetical protein